MTVSWITECPDVEAWADRILSGFIGGEHGCWVWKGGLDRYGYGRFHASIDGRRRYLSAHRAAWLALRGPIPYPLMPDHLCRNRACINPDHMEIVTNSINALRGDTGKALKPRGIQGCGKHGVEDGRPWTDKRGRTRWVCRPCQNVRKRAYEARCAA